MTTALLPTSEDLPTSGLESTMDQVPPAAWPSFSHWVERCIEHTAPHLRHLLTIEEAAMAVACRWPPGNLIPRETRTREAARPRRSRTTSM